MKQVKLLSSQENNVRRPVVPKIPRKPFEAPSMDYVLSKRLKLKTSLDFRLDHNFITISKPSRIGESLKVIKKCFQRKRWKPIKLFIQFQSEVGDKDLKEFCERITRYFSGLKQFEIEFLKYNKIPESQIQVFGRRISHNLTDLQALRVYFCGVLMRAQYDLTSFGNELTRHQSKLRNLCISFNKSKDTGIDTRKFCRYLIKLNHLKLIWGRCEYITEKDFKGLADGIMKSIPKLKALTLDTSWCYQNMTDQIFQAFVQQIHRPLAQLQEFRLKFEGSSRITNKSLSMISSQLFSRLVNLREICLNFCFCLGITDYGLKVLGEGIVKYSTNLNKISIACTGCLKISDEGIQEFGSEIANLNQLEYLQIKYHCWPTELKTWFKEKFQNVPKIDLCSE